SVLFLAAAGPRSLSPFPTRRSSDLCRRDPGPEPRDLPERRGDGRGAGEIRPRPDRGRPPEQARPGDRPRRGDPPGDPGALAADEDRKSIRLNSSHVKISYAVFCLKK